MKNFNRMKSFVFTSVIIALLLFPGCKEKGNPAGNNTQISFPEFFFEKGSDVDSSYISFRGVKKNSDTLEIQATSWGVIEYGLFLSKKTLGNEIQYQMMGECGTVSSETWTKVTLKAWIKAEETTALRKLSFTNTKDTIDISIK
ncbi:MAG: hypothetical protein WCS69_10505 [Ignavibacteriaceae bacterium]|jgi:hypothetical protein